MKFMYFAYVKVYINKEIHPLIDIDKGNLSSWIPFQSIIIINTENINYYNWRNALENKQQFITIDFVWFSLSINYS